MDCYNDDKIANNRVLAAACTNLSEAITRRSKRKIAAQLEFIATLDLSKCSEEFIDRYNNLLALIEAGMKFKVGDHVAFQFVPGKTAFTGVITKIDHNPKNKPYIITEDGSSAVRYSHEDLLVKL
jgi:hypothetical protein